MAKKGYFDQERVLPATHRGFSAIKCEKCGSTSNLYDIGLRTGYKTFRCVKHNCWHVQKVGHEDPSNEVIKYKKKKGERLK